MTHTTIAFGGAPRRRRGRRRPHAAAAAAQGQTAQAQAETEQTRENEILQAFTTPGHPIAYSAPDAVSRYFGITRSKAKSILQQSDAYNLHREFKRPSQYNIYYEYHLLRNCQADLIDIRSLSRYNDQYKHLLLIIDLFSRKVWVYPLYSKTGKEMRDTLRLWLDRDLQGRQSRLRIFRTDAGNKWSIYSLFMGIML